MAPIRTWGVMKRIGEGIRKLLMRRQAKLVGTDHYGNKYYELPAMNEMNRPRRWIKPPKGFEVSTFDPNTIPGTRQYILVLFSPINC